MLQLIATVFMAIPTHFPTPFGATAFDQLIQTFREKGPLTASDEELMRATYQERRYGKNEHVYQAGQVCPHACYIVRGVFREYHMDDHGAEHTIRLSFDDYFVGDQQSLFSLEPSGHSVQCLEVAVVLTLNKAGYEYLFANSPTFGEIFRFIRNRSFNVSMQQLTDKSAKTSEQRYRDLMAENPQIFQRVALKHIASWMGVQPETLSRIRKHITF